ncbi:MAG TPA: GNAT family N-acetyltransferase [Terricaulis sp.]|nr:GNAT family N-acetyltransferase [Terricaulis sp.]
MSDLHAAPRLETDRLILRAWRQSDIEPFVAMMAEPEVARFLNSTQAPMDRIDAWRALAFNLGHWALRGNGLFAVEEKASGAFVGRIGAWRPEGREDVELGWGLARGFSGRGYAREAARAAGDWMFAELSLSHIASFIHADNAPSQKLARRLGMRPAEETYHAGMPHVIWRVTKAQWTP